MWSKVLPGGAERAVEAFPAPCHMKETRERAAALLVEMRAS